MQRNNPYRIYLSPPHQSGEELEYLKKALESNWLAPGGIYVKQFEDKLKKVTNRDHCVALNSGTAAIHLALKALGVEPGSYVMCQTFSFVATANPIAYLGAHPVFIDSEAETWNMDPELLEKAILDLKKSNIRPKAIIYTHVFGTPARVDGLMRISENHQIPLVEDAAEALGANFKESPVGQFGKISVLSFNGNKVITTSGGGALLTNDPQISQKVLHLSTQARDESKPYIHTEVGYNYRMSNLSASLGLAQIEFLKEWVGQKRKIFKRYQQGISNKQIHVGDEFSDGVYANRWLSTFLVKSPKRRDEIIEILESQGIESRRFWKPLHLLNIFKGQKSYMSGVAHDLFEKGICLPSGVGLKKETLEEIIQYINSAD